MLFHGYPQKQDVSQGRHYKRVLHYLAGTYDHNNLLRSNNHFTMHVFFDDDWAGNRDDYSSIGAYNVYLGLHLVLWVSKKQRMIARSSTKAKYKAAADTNSELGLVHSLLYELGTSIAYPPVIYFDNVGATYFCANPVFHSRMKHVATDYHFISVGKVWFTSCISCHLCIPTC